MRVKILFKLCGVKGTLARGRVAHDMSGSVTLKELGIQLIPAYSPQARGRSERGFGTWQGRLPQELRVRGISTLEEATASCAKSIAESLISALEWQPVSAECAPATQRSRPGLFASARANSGPG
jgi:hypothetical protein